MQPYRNKVQRNARKENLVIRTMNYECIFTKEYTGSDFSFVIITITRRLNFLIRKKCMLQKWYDLARELKNKLNKELPVIDLRVYGSCARGEETDESDLDIYVEIEQLSKEAKEKIREIAWNVGLENETVISTLIFSKDEIDRSPLKSSPIVKNILKEGIRI